LGYRPLPASSQKRKAKDALKKIKHIGSIQAYLQRFNNLVAEIPVEERPKECDLIDMFVMGLQPDLRRLCAMDRVAGDEWKSLERCQQYTLNLGCLEEASRAREARKEAHQRGMA